MQVHLIPELATDSRDYDVLTEGVEKVRDVEGLTCEIGLRRGGGTKFILDAIKATNQGKVHIAIDPYGNIEFYEGTISHRLDYTNAMRDEALSNLYLYTFQNEMPFIFFNLEDTEFFTRFADGVPVYQETKHLLNSYAFVHFDGPHTVRHLKAEIDFFHARSPRGAVWVFDDVKLYDHSQIHEYLRTLQWSLYRTTDKKWAYTKQ